MIGLKPVKSERKHNPPEFLPYSACFLGFMKHPAEPLSAATRLKIALVLSIGSWILVGLMLGGVVELRQLLTTASLPHQMLAHDARSATWGHS